MFAEASNTLNPLNCDTAPWPQFLRVREGAFTGTRATDIPWGGILVERPSHPSRPIRERPAVGGVCKVGRPAHNLRLRRTRLVNARLSIRLETSLAWAWLTLLNPQSSRGDARSPLVRGWVDQPPLRMTFASQGALSLAGLYDLSIALRPTPFWRPHLLR